MKRIIRKGLDWIMSKRQSDALPVEKTEPENTMKGQDISDAIRAEMRKQRFTMASLGRKIAAENGVTPTVGNNMVRFLNLDTTYSHFEYDTTSAGNKTAYAYMVLKALGIPEENQLYAAIEQYFGAPMVVKQKTDGDYFMPVFEKYHPRTTEFRVDIESRLAGISDWFSEGDFGEKWGYLLRIYGAMHSDRGVGTLIRRTNGETLKNIAQDYKVSDERVRGLSEAGLRKLVRFARGRRQIFDNMLLEDKSLEAIFNLNIGKDMVENEDLLGKTKQGLDDQRVNYGLQVAKIIYDALAPKK